LLLKRIVLAHNHYERLSNARKLTRLLHSAFIYYCIKNRANRQLIFTLPQYIEHFACADNL
jgi:hypothetical protein